MSEPVVLQGRIDRLAQFTDSELREEWAEVLQQPPPAGVTRALLLLSLAYRLQETAEGSLPPRIQNMLNKASRALSKGERLRPPKCVELPIGSELAREWRGKVYRIVAVAEGFLMDGRIFNSLTEAATSVAGYKYPGPRFFGLRRRRRRPVPVKASTS